jgi:hypothetical protein
MAAIEFQNPSNGYTEQVRFAGLWTLLFGPLYFAVKGVWTHAIIAFVLMPTVISWFIYPFFARQIVIRSYLRAGWKPLQPVGL